MGVSILKETWSSGRKIYWGVILFLAYFFLSMFFYDETLYFKVVFTLVMALFALILTLRATSDEKNTKVTRLYTNKYLYIIYLFLLIILSIIVFVNIGSIIQTKYVLFSLAMSGASSIFEESLGRGFLLSGCVGLMEYHDEKFPITKAAILSSVLYSILYLLNAIFIPFHIIIQQVLCIYTIGTIMSLIKTKTGNLLLPIVIHFFMNWGSLGLVNSDLINWLVIFLFYIPLSIISVLNLAKIDQ